MKLITSLLLTLLVSATIHAQDSTLVVSPPINITQDGWNKVLQLRNGNTMLFHFELRKHILVKVFDKTGKEVASKKSESSIIDVSTLDLAFFDGLYDINNEGVLFITQDIDNLTTLVRMRFNGNDGSLIAEDRVVKSETFHKKTSAFILKKDESDNYSIFCFISLPTDTATNLKLIKYNGKHEVVKEIPYSISNKGYDNINFIAASIEPGGDILISLELAKIIQYPVLYERTLALMYMPDGEDKFYFTKMVLPSTLKIIAADFTTNPFAGNINLFVSKKWEKKEQNGLNEEVYDIIIQSLYVFPKDFSGVKEAFFKHEKGSELMAQAKGVNSSYWGSKVIQTTNERGLTTVVFETHGVPKYVYEKWKRDPPAFSGNVCITQFDDNGKEISALILPKSNYYKQTETYPSVFKKISRTELYSSLCFNSKKSYYVLYNDAEINFDKSLADSLQDIFSYDTTNTVYYRIGKKNLVEKKRFFNTQVNGEYNQIYPRSAHYSLESKILAVLSKRTKDKKSTLHLAWRRMED